MIGIVIGVLVAALVFVLCLLVAMIHTLGGFATAFAAVVDKVTGGDA